jgi:hypothetical protein
MPQYVDDLPFEEAAKGPSIFDPAPASDRPHAYASADELPVGIGHDRPALPYATNEDVVAQFRDSAAAKDRKIGDKRAGIGNVKDKVFDAVHDLFGGQVTRALPEEYANETVDSSDVRGAAAGWTRRAEHGPDFVGPLPQGAARAQFSEIKTRYFDEAEQQASTVRAKDGRLVDPKGQLVDTTAATGIGTFMAGGAGKHIYAMGEDNEMRAVDPWAAHRETRLDGGTDDPGTAVPHALELVNHSSLIAGDRAAAAGEITAEKGKLQQVSDQSGHYRPDNPMLHQAVKHFADEGIDMHDVAVKMVGKKQGKAPTIASAREFMKYAGSADAQKEIHTNRKEMREDIEEAVDERPEWDESFDPRAGRGPRVGRVVDNPVKPAEIADRGGPGRVRALADVFNHYSK